MTAQVSLADVVDSRQLTEIFPLPLTPFEEYMWAESRIGNNMSFYLKVEAEGSVDVSCLETAVQIASARHPLTRATLKRRGWRAWKWELPVDCWPAVVAWPEPPCPSNWQTPLNLECESGVRVLVKQQGSLATLYFQFHHACCDGVGAFQWLGDVLAYYGMQTGEQEVPRVAPIDLQRLKDRGRARHGAFRGLRWLTEHCREGKKLWLQPPRPLRTDKPKAAVEPVQPVPDPFTTFSFSAEETSQLRQVAQSQQATINEQLLRDLFRTIADWNANDRGNPWYRINMPTSLRERADVATPAANLMSMTFLNRRRSAVVDEPSRLLGGILQESNDIKRDARGTLLLEGLKLGAKIPGLMSGPLKLPLCMSTAVLTNVGDPSRRFSARFPRADGRLVAGNLFVKSITGVPPLRAKTHAAVGVTNYCGNMAVSLMMTRETFTSADVDRFLQLFVNRIRESHCHKTASQP